MDTELTRGIIGIMLFGAFSFGILGVFLMGLYHWYRAIQNEYK